MAEFSVRQEAGENGVSLEVNGSLTVENVAEMREALLTAFAHGELVTVDLSAAEAIDINGLQLLCSAHLTSLNRKKELTVLGITKPVVRSAAEIAGFFRHVGCAQDSDGTCIWVGGERECQN